jgi:hypothetical protein
MEDMKLLCTNEKSFGETIRENFVYDDKTEYICKILNTFQFKSCFLSRPRRFGKTLLLSTVRELFQGDRELFRDLWIGKATRSSKGTRSRTST